MWFSLSTGEEKHLDRFLDYYLNLLRSSGAFLNNFNLLNCWCTRNKKHCHDRDDFFFLSPGCPKKACDYKIFQIWSLATERGPETTERHPSYPAIEEVQATGRKEKGPGTGQCPQASYHTSQQTPSFMASHRTLSQPQLKTGEFAQS